MRNITPHWSQTSSRLLRACPRSWALTYAISPTDLTSSRRGTRGVQHPRTKQEVEVRALRDAWIERLQDHFLGKQWSLMYRLQRTRHHLEDAFLLAGINNPPLHLEMAVERLNEQLRRLEQTIGLRPLFSSRRARWAYFERLQSALLPGFELYAAPDVAIHHQHKWVLIRIQFRSPAHPPLSQQLEHLLMVHWAMAQPGFPNNPQAYAVKVIRWHRSRWLEHHVAFTPQLLEQALSLAYHDLQEMQWLSRSRLSDPDLRAVPLALEDQTCKGCHHRSSCPAKNGLARAKRAQERTLLTLNQSAETKSARTA